MFKDFRSRNVFIPIETKARELDSKLLFALFAINRGYHVYLGQHGELYDLLKSTPRSILVEHSIAGGNGAHYQRLRERGHRLVAWDEEGFLPIDRDYYLDRRIGRTGLDAVDWHFTWGPMQAEWIDERYPEHGSKVVPVGNPRLDVLRPEFRDFYAEEAQAYRERCGDYILFCSSFSRANIHHGDIDRFVRSVVEDAQLSPEREAFYRRWIEFSGTIMQRFLTLIPRLARAFPDTTLVIRPHPSEDFNLWRRCVEGIPNAQVIFEGSAPAWIHGAAAVLHNSCTTAVEAALMERPVIAYCPHRSSQFEVDLPHAVSRIAESEEAVETMVRKSLTGAEAGAPLPLGSVLETLSSVVTAFDGPLSCERALERIDSVPVERELFRNYLRKKKNRMRLHLRARQQAKAPHPYRLQKFEGLSASELEAKLNRLIELEPRLGAYRLSHLYKTCFRIER